MTNRVRPEPIPGFALLYFSTLVMAAGNLAMMSIFPAIARSSGIPDVAMVAVQSVSAGLSIVAMPFWASRSDRIGRKPVILIGIAGFTVASALTAGAIYLAVERLVPVMLGLAALVASRAVFGSVGLAAAPAIQAHVADQTTPAQRTGALASVYSAHGLGSIIGPGLAPLLILPYVGLAGPQLVFTLIGCAALIAVICKLPRQAAQPGRSDRRPHGSWTTVRRPSVWPFVAYLVMLSGAQAANLQMIGFVVIDRLGLEPLEAQPLAGIAMMVGAAVAVTIQVGVLRRISAGPALLMTCGCGLFVLGNILMAVATSYGGLVIAYVLGSSGAAIGMPAAVSGASIANASDRQGAVAGLASSAVSSGLLAAPVAAMMTYRHSPAAAFLAVAATLIITALIVVPRAGRQLRPTASADGLVHEGQ